MIGEFPARAAAIYDAASNARCKYDKVEVEVAGEIIRMGESDVQWMCVKCERGGCG